MVDWFILFHFLGAVQGVFLAAILVSKRRGSVATRILAVTMLVFAVDLAMAVYHAANYEDVFPHLIGVDYASPLLYGPLFYLYARTLSDQEKRFQKGYFWHFIPFGVLLVVLIPFYVQSGPEKIAFLNASDDNPWSQGLSIFNNVKLLHGLIYIGMTLNVLRLHRKRIQNTYSSIERINLLWLRNLMIGIIALAGISLAFQIFTFQQESPAMGLNSTTLLDDYTLLGLALFVYFAGFMGMRQPEVFDIPEDEQPLDTSRSAPAYIPATPSSSNESVSSDLGSETEEKPRYAKSGMDVSTAQDYKDQLLALMNTKQLYRKGDLTLHDLSNALSISPHNLTEVINTQFGQNFYDFVNGYRVREIKERLIDPEYSHYTLLAIALESGFNSKSSFNAVFKKHTHMTPSRYRKQVEEVNQ